MCELHWRQIGPDPARGRRRSISASRPATPSRNILFHDRNNRDVERLMQDLDRERRHLYRVADRSHVDSYNRQIVRNALAERVG